MAEVIGLPGITSEQIAELGERLGATPRLQRKIPYYFTDHECLTKGEDCWYISEALLVRMIVEGELQVTPPSRNTHEAWCASIVWIHDDGSVSERRYHQPDCASAIVLAYLGAGNE